MLRQVKDLCERFGIPAAVFERLGTELGQGAVFVATREVMEFGAANRHGVKPRMNTDEHRCPDGTNRQGSGQSTIENRKSEINVRPMRKGMRLVRVFPHSVKPTTWAMQVLGRHATRNCIDVSESHAVRLIGGEQLEIEAEVQDGFVLIRCRGLAVGVGLYRRPLLKSQIPRHRPVEQQDKHQDTKHTG